MKACVAAVWNTVGKKYPTVITPWPATWWADYWLIVGIILPCVIAIITLIWFGIGGIMDLRLFFAALRTLKRDVRDDGRVIAHHNADEDRGTEVVAEDHPASDRSPAATRP